VLAAHQEAGSVPRVGNRLRAENRTYAVTDRRVSIDGNGNLLSDGTTTYTWDARNRMVALNSSSTSVTYGYDGGKLRSSVDSGGATQRTLLDGNEELATYSNGARLERYDHDPSWADALLAQSGQGNKVYFVTDALGTVYALVDSAGTPISRYSYDVFGGGTATQEGTATSWGFTGRKQSDGQLLYLRRRYYDPRASVWLSPDPVHSSNGLYAYAQQQPTIARDPSGLSAQFVLGWLFSLAAVGPSCWAAGKSSQVANSLLTTYFVDAEMLSRKAFNFREYRNGTWETTTFYYQGIFSHLGIGTALWSCTDCQVPATTPGQAGVAYEPADTEWREPRSGQSYAEVILKGDYWRYPVWQDGTRLHELVHALLKGMFFSGDPEYKNAPIGPADEPGLKHQGRFDPFKKVQAVPYGQGKVSDDAYVTEIAASLAGMSRGAPASRDVSNLSSDGAYLFEEADDE
jgi:RHS repeat-associated protein